MLLARGNRGRLTGELSLAQNIARGEISPVYLWAWCSFIWARHTLRQNRSEQWYDITGALDARCQTRERMRWRIPTKMTFLTTWPSWGETGNSKYIFSTVFPNNGPDGTKQVVKVWRSYLIYYTYNTYNSCPSLTGRAWADWGRWPTQWSASTAGRGSLTKAAGKRSWMRSSASKSYICKICLESLIK